MKNLTKFASRIMLASLVLMAVLVVPMNVLAEDPPIIVGGGGLAPSDPPVIIGGGGYAVPSDPPILIGGGGYAAPEPSILDEDALMKMMIDLVIW